MEIVIDIYIGFCVGFTSGTIFINTVKFIAKGLN